MASIDERVVAMAFENAKFEQGVAQTMSTLGKLDTAIKNIGLVNGLQNIEKAASKVTLEAPMSALDRLKARLGSVSSGRTFTDLERDSDRVTLQGTNTAIDKTQAKLGQLSAGTTFTDIEKASDRTNLTGLTDAISKVQSQFSVLEGAAAVALGNIASQAAMRGAAFGKSFAFGPIKQGFEEYATNLNSIQTILANTQDSGGNLDSVNAHLQELNKYSDQTIYNFSEMAKNIGTFTAAGVDLDKSTQSIKGIANLAALSGSNSQQASTAMYQLSQAIAAGKVGLQDWNSVVNAGMGGAVFQKALLRTADNMGSLEKGALKIDKATGKATINGESFRESIMAKPGQKSWLTSDVLVKTLQQFTGDMSKADLIAQGFSDDQATAILKQAETAKHAATEVKTLSQVFDVARETIGSGWSSTFQTVFGNFEQSKKTFTGLSTFINGFINQTSKARNTMLADWAKLGGRGELISGFKDAFAALAALIKPIHDAFREIFPATTGKELYNLTVRFKELMENLKIGPDTAANLKRTFAGFFAVLHIGFTIVKDVIGVIGKLLGFASKGSGGFLTFTGSVGDFLVALDHAISKGDALGGLFAGLTGVLRAPLEVLKALKDTLADLFDGAQKSGDGTGHMSSGVDRLVAALGPLGPVVETVVHALDHLQDSARQVAHFLSPVFDTAVDTVTSFADTLKQAISGIKFENVSDALTAGFTGGIFITLKKALGGGGIDLKFFDGIKKNVVETLDALTGSLKALQTNIKANTMLQIAIALGVLAAGVFVISQIDPKRLTSSMTAMAVGLGELVGAIKLITTGTGLAGVAQLPVIAASMILLATAVDLLSIAVFAFSRLSWEDLLKGLTGVGGALAAIGVGIKAIGPRVLFVGPALIPLAIGLNILAVAVKIFADMKWEDMAKGLAGVGGGLLAISLGLKSMGPTILLVGPGLIAAGFGLILLSGAVSSFGNLSLGEMAKGLVGVGAALLEIAIGVSLMPPTMALSAAGLVVLGVALNGIALAVAAMGSMKLSTLVKGLAGIAGALVIFAVGLTAMSGTLAGSAGLLAAAVALGILAPTLALLGNLSWGVIGKGLAAIALTMGTIAIVGLVAAPALLAMGAAMAALGVGVLVISTGIYILAKGISLLATQGQAGLTVLLTAITAFVAVLPKLIISFIQGLVSIADEIAKVAPKVAIALGVVIDSLLTTIIEAAPKLAVAAGALIDAFLLVINDNAPNIIASGLKLLLNFLSGIANNVDEVTTQVANIVIHFLDALTANLPRIVRSGANTVVAYLQGIANNIGRVLASAANVVVKFLEGVTAQLPRMATAGTRMIVTLLNSIAAQLPSIIRSGANLIVKFLEGIADNLPRIVAAGTRVISKFIGAIIQASLKLVDTAARALITFLNGLADAIRKYEPQLIQAGYNIASAIVEGLINGLAQLGPKVIKAVEHLITSLPNKALKILGIHSPSTVFHAIGENVMYGLAGGLASASSSATDALTAGLKQLLKETGDGKKFGKFLSGEFTTGLEGSAEDIATAFTNLRGKIKDEQDKLRADIKTDRAKLKTLMSADKPNEDKILSVWSDIQQNEKLLQASKDATKSLMAGLKDEKGQLLSLAASYADVSTKLQEAETALADATKQRDDAIKSYSDQYSSLPDIDTGVKNQVAAYKQALQEQIKATEKYMQTLQKLRDLGLDDATYKKLLSEGTKDQDFASQLLAGGKGTVDQINKLDSQLQKDATDLANQASANLYQAGVNAAQGLVDGLKAQQSAIQDQMNSIATAMVTAIKKQLGIKSPSKIMAEIGRFTAEGVVAGLRAASGSVASAASDIGDDAAAAMSKSLARVGESVSAEIDINPTITPVLDLSAVQKDAAKLSDLTNVVPITAAASYGQASAISSEQQTAQDASAATMDAPVQQFMFEQNNYSPESLSNVEIYRQTNNQLAQARRALGLAG